MRHSPSLLASFFASMLVLAGVVQAQTLTYPTKPVRIVVTAAAGGVTDIMTRVLSEQVGASLGQPVLVENRPGAGGAIAMEFVSKAAPDGHTLVIANVGNAAIAPWINKQLPYDPIKDLVGVAPVAQVPTLVAIHAKLPVKDLKEFIEHARRNPGKINYGSAGNATMPHLAAELFKFLTATDMVHVPYKGAAPAAVDLAADRVQVAFIGLGSMNAQLAARQVRVIAVGTPSRIMALPDVPTFEEAGLSGYEVTNWFGVLAPRGTPGEIVHRLNAEIGNAFTNPEVDTRLQKLGIVPMRESVEAFQKRILADHAKWRDVVRRAGITVQ
jgi:tripartite-type tricarboxylate transporter receptor subunit TctC